MKSLPTSVLSIVLVTLMLPNFLHGQEQFSQSYSEVSESPAAQSDSSPKKDVPNPFELFAKAYSSVADVVSFFGYRPTPANIARLFINLLVVAAFIYLVKSLVRFSRLMAASALVLFAIANLPYLVVLFEEAQQAESVRSQESVADPYYVPQSQFDSHWASNDSSTQVYQESKWYGD